MKMNQYDVEDAVEIFDDPEYTPNLFRAVNILFQLMRWTNRNSDGWHSWQKPGNAAGKLQDLIEQKRADFRHGARYDGSEWIDPADITDAELKAVLSPIKGFCTSQQKETSHRDRSQPRMTQAERDDILLAGSKRPVKALHLTARISFAYQVSDGLVTNAEQARQDFFDCLASVSPNDFTITVTEEV